MHTWRIKSLRLSKRIKTAFISVVYDANLHIDNWNSGVSKSLMLKEQLVITHLSGDISNLEMPIITV